jgi:hypothetical protein
MSTDKSQSPLDELLGCLNGVRRRRGGASALCPAHDDRKPSLLVREQKNGAVSIRCMAGCRRSEILDALELKETDLDPELEAIYRYESAGGELLYEKLRRKGKRFLFRRSGADGKDEYKLGPERVLYRLPLIANRKLAAGEAGQQLAVMLVEGEKDADRLLQEGILATTTATGAAGKWLPEYTSALQGCVVVVIPDNDEAGERYAISAADALTAAGIEVRMLKLPKLPPNGDVSDWLAAGGRASDLKEMAEATPRWESRRQDPRDDVAVSGHPFVERDGRICVETRDGESTTPLTNFTVRIVEDVVHDDGVERTRKYRLSSPQFPPLEIDAVEFPSLSWIPLLGGARAIVRSGSMARSRLAEAIQQLSQPGLRERVVYTHLGWREIAGAWYFLHAGGAISAIGPVDNIEVQADGHLKYCVLPDVHDLPTAVRASLRFLEVAPPRIAYPLLAGVYRAPLSEFAPATVALFLAGETGSRKSAVTGVAQAHFGAHFSDGKSFIANWSSTGNSIERLAFLAKDIICTIDDFVIKGGSNDIQRLQRTADQLIRGQGNRAGRGRLRADATLRPEMHPRGLILASGEVTPEGKSLSARMLVVDIGTTDVKNEVLTLLQHDARDGLLAEAMSGYVQWLARRVSAMREKLPAEQETLRAQVAANHARTSENMAQLFLGLRTFLDFAVDLGVLTQEQSDKHQELAWGVFREQAIAQDRQIKSEDPIEHFFFLLKTVLTSGNRGHLLTRSENRPNAATSLGWKEHISERQSGDGETYQIVDWRPSGDVLGWIEGDELYLESHATYAAIKKLATENNLPMPIPVNQLGKRLKERKLLRSTRAPDETKTQVTIGSRVVTTAWHLSATQAIGFAASEQENVEEKPDEDLPF